MKRTICLIIISILFVVLLVFSVLNWCKIDDLQKELKSQKKQHSELELKQENFEQAANTMFESDWRSLARIRRNFIALKHGGLEDIDVEETHGRIARH